MKTAVLFFLALLLAGSSVQAQNNPFGSIKAVKNIPIYGVKIIESDKGTFFVSENGRFAWKGPVYDMWNGKNVQTMEDVDQVVNHLDVKKFGLEPDKLATLTIGQGPQEELVFVSSDCTLCRKLLKQAQSLGDQYRFKVVLIPMGPKSLEHTKRLLCTKDQGAAIKALVSGDFKGLGPGDCELTSLRRTLVAARVLGLRSVPYLVRHDGKVHTGELKDLAGWLAGREEKLGQVLGAKKEATK
jgi:thiol:disulfide interchange protein DsbC